VTVIAHRLSLPQRQLGLLAVGGSGDDADGQDDHTEVHHHPAVGTPDEPAPPSHVMAARGADREHERTHRRRGGECPEAEAHQGGKSSQPEDDAEHHGEHPGPGRNGQAVPQDRPADFAPTQRGRHGHQEEEGQAEWNGDGVEEGRAHIDLLLGDRLVEEGVERAQQDDEREPDEEEVVEQEGAFATERGVDTSRRA
jgi:hypothetical protein